MINGLSMGMLYAMLAMALVLLIRAVGVLNFAQGSLIVLGASISSWLIVDCKLPLFAALPIMVVLYLATGVLFMLSTYWPLRNASYAVAAIIATIGMSTIITELIPILFGTWPRTLPNLFAHENGSPLLVNIFGASIQVQYLALFAVSGLAMLLVYVLFNRMYFGRMMQAAAQDKWAANLVGISPFFTTSMTYMIVVFLISLGGYMVAPIYTVTPSLTSMQMRAMVGTVVGGYGDIRGSIVGCLIVGLVESFASVFFSMYKDAFIFLLLLVFLIIRPQGLFKSTVGDKA
jgi:branched-chain amino acid transport system permease protein